MTELWPALLDALARAGIGVMAFATRDDRFYKVYANDAAVRALGYTAEEWMAAPMWATIPDEHRGFIENMYARIRAGEPVPPLVELILKHRDGSTLRGEYVASRTDTADGPAFVLVARDVGSLLKAQLSLLESDRLALVGALAAGFAHEINNPLTSVVLNLRSLKKQLSGGGGDAGAAMAMRCVDDLTLAAERIAGNVRALQTMASTSSGRGVVDLGGVVVSALRLALPTLEPRAVVTKRIATGLRVSGEEARLAQAVLAMLLFSASGFAEPSSRSEISVVVETRDGMHVVEVSDNGATLDPEEARRAFDPFFQSPSRGAGVGVGLGIAQSIAVTLAGNVALSAREGGGAVMMMRLPPV